MVRGLQARGHRKGNKDGMACLTPACALCLLPSSGPDIKRLYRQAGVELKPTSFLFVDTQIADESFLEDINNILSSGEVPNLYKADEFEEVQAPPPPSTSGCAPLTTPPSDRCHRGPTPWGSALQPQPCNPANMASVQIQTLIMEQAKAEQVSPSSDSLFTYLIERVRDNLHIILCLSPVGDPFR